MFNLSCESLKYIFLSILYRVYLNDNSLSLLFLIYAFSFCWFSRFCSTFLVAVRLRFGWCYSRCCFWFVLFWFYYYSMLFLWQSSSGCSLKTQIMCIFSVFFYFRIFRCPFTEQICHKRPCLINLHIHMERRSSFEQTAYRLSIKNGV